MTRKITMLGNHAQYLEHKGAASPDDDREIIMEGENARYEELADREVPHFPLTNNEEMGKRLYELLLKEKYIESDTSLSCWLFTMGYSNAQPAGMKPIVWCKTKEAAQVMLRGAFADMLQRKELTVSRMMQLTELCFTTQDGKPLKLAKPKKELSRDIDLLENFFRPFPT